MDIERFRQSKGYKTAMEIVHVNSIKVINDLRKEVEHTKTRLAVAITDPYTKDSAERIRSLKKRLVILDNKIKAERKKYEINN